MVKPTENREEALFREAIQRASGPERQTFLHQACAGDETLRQRLEALIQVHESPDPFLDPNAGPSARATIRFHVPVEEAPGARIGRYKLLEKIGEGGCGRVYVAEQEEPVRRRVALKVIKLGMDTRQVIARFEAERQALALMDHPNIAKVLDAGATESGRPFFVMELVKGIPITRFCDENQMSTQGRLSLFIQVCQAVQHAHQKGIIHRDLKPTNILVANHDGVSVPKVIDFGIAKATTDQRLTDKTLYTAIEQFIGTPAYMSPEQASLSNLDVDTRSDIYSLGVLLYELLTGRTPFDAQELVKSGLEAIRQTVLEVDPPPPSKRLSTLRAETLTATSKQHGAESMQLLKLVRGDLDWIVMKCLEKDRTRRYATANGLAADLQRHLENEPVVARPPSAAYRLQKLVRRNKLIFTAGAAAAAALVVGTGISTWQAVVATRAKTKAVAAQKETQQAKEAEKSIRIEAQHQLYAAKMNLAQQAWEQDNIGRLQELLVETQDSPYRGFEWYYWQQQIHLSLKTLRGHFDVVSSVAFSPDGKRIVTGSWDQTANVWDAASGRQLLTLKGHRGKIRSVAFAPDGQRIVTGSDDAMAKVWEAASGEELLTLEGRGGAVWCVAFSPDGQRIVSGGEDRTAKIWEAASGKELLTLAGHSNTVSSVGFSPDGQRVVTGSWDQTARVWDVTNGKELFRLMGQSNSVLSVAFSPDGQRIVTGSDQTAKVWEAATGKELLTLKGHGANVLSVAFSSNGQRIVTGSWDQTARVWDSTSGKEVFALKGHGSAVHSVAFSPDGRRIVSASEDQTAKVWEAASRGELLTLKGHGGPVWCVAFSPDSQRIVSGGEAGRPRYGRRPVARNSSRLRGTETRFPLWAFPRTAGGL